jgi:type VI secretion system secreted protein VgrG
MSVSDPIRFTSSALPDDARVIAFRGREALGAPFEYEIWVSTASGDEVDLEDALYASASLVVDRGDARGPQNLRGIVAGIDHVHEHGGRAIFSVHVVPRLWLLGQSEHSRVFVQKSFDAIFETIVDAVGIAGADLDLRLGGLPVEDHVCQYRESDLTFLHRWLEREGLTYWFEHDDEAEKLVVTDAQPSTEIEGGPVRYHPSLGAEAADFLAQGHVQRLRTRRRSMPRAVKLKDYDYAKPQLDVSGEDEVLSRGQVEVVRFGDRFFAPDRASALAKLRAQALRSQQEVQIAEGNVLGVRPGRVVELEQHPRAALNQKYLVLSAEHSGITPSAVRDVLREIIGFEHEDLYRVRAELLTTSVEYKPERKTAWPRIHSQELAVIDGDADSDYAQLDDQGRYKVKFLFDEGDGKGDKASTRVRMMQPHGGNPEGMHFPLRKGTEVVVTFLGGDPDRPLIAGAVPHAETPSPVTSANHTRNILITGGRNKLEIEDLDGQQWINWYTPSQNTEIHMGHPKPFGKANANLGEHTDGTASFTFGGDWYVDVGGLHDEHVVGPVFQKYDATKEEFVAGDVMETYAVNQDISVGAKLTHTVGATMTEEIAGLLDQTLKDGWKQTVTSGWNQTIAGGWNQTVDHVVQTSGPFIQRTGMFSQTTGPAVISQATQVLKVAGTANWHIGGGVTLFAPSLNTVGASWTRTDASIYEHTNFKAETYIAKAEAGAIALAYTGLKREATGLALGYTGVSIEAKGANLENDGIDLKKRGPAIYAAAIQVFT